MLGNISMKKIILLLLIINMTIILNLSKKCEGKNVENSPNTVEENEEAEDKRLEKLLYLEKSEMKNRMNLLFDFIDSDKNGGLNKVELVSWAERIKKQVNIKHGVSELEAADKDNDKKISFEELKAAHLDTDETDAKSIEDLKRRFEVVDKDKNNYLDASEMAILLNPATDEKLVSLEIELILEAHDKDGNRLLSLSELTSIDSTDELSAEELNQLRAEFKTYDVNEDGFVSEDEIKQVVASTGGTDVEKSVDEMFTNSTDTVISREEWEKNYQKYIISVATDSGELLRFPEDYNFSLPFKNVQKPEQHDAEKHDEL